MGYYADGNGYVTVRKLEDKRMDELENVLKDCGCCFDYDISDNANHTEVCLNFYEKYYGDSVEELLNNLIQFGIVDGEVEFSGEDYCHWRFKWYDKPKGHWEEQNGHVVYDE